MLDGFDVFLQLVDFDGEDAVTVLIALNLLIFFLEKVGDLHLTIV